MINQVILYCTQWLIGYMSPKIQVDVIASCPCIYIYIYFGFFFLFVLKKKSKLLLLCVSPRSYFIIAELERSITSVLHMHLNLIRINSGQNILGGFISLFDFFFFYIDSNIVVYYSCYAVPLVCQRLAR
jgi:hypothetical protein